ncbi:hypothetical protein UY3_12082 [Chelonia mydas]|uniref:Uncharacterized protein n=1 Tax=Chelonia mydas TaxID=8469 RepID=M7BRN4_CHEMY|nr:hypothetical protein UY3_12082 [Chelonia mydas]
MGKSESCFAKRGNGNTDTVNLESNELVLNDPFDVQHASFGFRPETFNHKPPPQQAPEEAAATSPLVDRGERHTPSQLPSASPDQPLLRKP